MSPFFSIPLPEQILCGVFLLVWCYQLYFWLRYMQGVNRWQRRQRKGKLRLSAEQPPVSVIVCARNEEQNLSDYLPQLLSQRYPCFEVIVVDDGSEDNTRLVVERLKHRYQNLHLTFVPHDARVTSSKKLALTLAAKAAQYDYLLLTDADCRPESELWIAEMMQGFAEGVEVVLGYGAYFEQKTLLNRVIQYDTLFSGMQYLGMASSRHPYMGVGRNLAYRKDTFFRNHGFSGMLDSRAGDDDLFVNKVARRCNTAIVASRESVTWSVPKPTWHSWLQQKRRHLSVSPRYRAGSKFRLTAEPLSRALLFGSFMALCCVSSMPLLPLLAAGMLVLRWLWQTLILNTTAHRLGMHGFCMAVWVMDILMPLLTLGIMTRNAIVHDRQRW